MRENEHFWLGITLSNDPAPDNLFLTSSPRLKPGDSLHRPDSKGTSGLG